MIDITKKSFDNSVSEYDSDVMKKHEVEIIRRYFRGKNILDVGCGVGRTTQYLHKKGFSVVGIDYSNPLITRAKKKYKGILFMVMDARKLQFKSNTFDVVYFSFNGIDYLQTKKDRLSFLVEAHRVLRNGGVLIYSSHKRFNVEFPFMLKFPFVKIHYLRTLVASIFAMHNYRWEKHPFGWARTYCANDSSQQPLAAGFKKVLRIPKNYFSEYICYK